MKMKNFDFSKYCTPAQLYLAIGVICIISGFFANYSIEMLLTKGLFLVIWSWVLNWLCSKGFKAISWILVLLPFIFFLFTYFLIKDVAVKEGITIGGKGGIIKPKPGAGGSGICDATCQANKKANQEKAATEKAAAEKKRQEDADAAEKKRQEDAVAAAKVAACQACGNLTGLKSQNSCKRQNQC